MPVFEQLYGMRVVADPAAIDGARWTAYHPTGREVLVLRFAPDEAFALHATAVEIDDEHAIAEHERGIVGAWFTVFDLPAIVARLEWSLTDERPSFVQGAVAGVPARIWQPAPEPLVLDGIGGLILTSAAHAAGLAERLGWPR